MTIKSLSFFYILSGAQSLIENIVPSLFSCSDNETKFLNWIYVYQKSFAKLSALFTAPAKSVAAEDLLSSLPFVC